MDTKLHILKKRLSAVASYSKNNNYFWHPSVSEKEVRTLIRSER